MQFSLSRVWSFLLQLFRLSALHCESASPTVTTQNGLVQGFSALNGTVDVFFGIPYAQAPVGELRLQKPAAVKNWNGVLNASTVPLSCYPHATPDWLNVFVQQGASSEDCLYLNIFSPHQRNQSQLLPTMVIIHGGGFEIGASAQFSNYTDIGNNFVRKGIVVVSIQYRMGELGFASTGDGVLPGNLGLWDQRQALLWLHANIAAFGGDPQQVTVMGQSAGAASASSLGLSPHSRDLFRQSIQMSGSSATSWVYGSRVVNSTVKLASTLNCSTSSSSAIRQCLMAATPEQMLAAVVQMGPNRAEPNCLIFGPRYDGDFFPEPPLELAKKTPKKATLVGFTQLESLIFTLLTGSNSTLSDQMLPWSVLDTYSASDLANYIGTQVAYEQRFGNARGSVSDQIFQFYANRTINSSAYNGSTFYIRQYTELVSDLMFVMPILMEVQTKVQSGWSSLFMYINNYFNLDAFPSAVPIHESFHTNDLNLVFYTPFVGYTFTEQDLKMQAFLLEAFRNFIKLGNPSTKVSSPLSWPPVSSAALLNHVRIASPGPVVSPNASEVLTRLAFWTQLSAKYPQYNLLQELAGQTTGPSGGVTLSATVESTWQGGCKIVLNFTNGASQPICAATFSLALQNGASIIGSWNMNPVSGGSDRNAYSLPDWFRLPVGQSYTDTGLILDRADGTVSAQITSTEDC